MSTRESWTSVCFKQVWTQYFVWHIVIETLNIIFSIKKINYKKQIYIVFLFIIVIFVKKCLSINNNIHYLYINNPVWWRVRRFWCLTPLSTIFQLPGENHRPITDKLYHIMLNRVHLAMKSNYQVHMTTPYPLYGNVLNRVHLAIKSNYHMTTPSPFMEMKSFCF
jgi:hypothetical protein